MEIDCIRRGRHISISLSQDPTNLLKLSADFLEDYIDDDTRDREVARLVLGQIREYLRKKNDDNWGT